MKRLKYACTAISLSLALLVSSSCAVRASRHRTGDAPSDNQKVEELASEVFKCELANSPISASMTVGDLSKYGLENLASELDQMSQESFDEYYAALAGLMDKANGIVPDQLAPGNLKLLNLIKYNLAMEQEDGRYLLDQHPVNQSLGVQISVPITLTQLPLASEQDVRDYLSRLGEMDRLMNQLADFERKKIANKSLLPKELYDKIIKQCRDFAEIPPDESVFYLNLKDQLNGISSISQASTGTYLDECLDIVTNKIDPSYETLISALEDAKAATAITGGLWQYADGKQYYSYIVRKETGEDITPEKLYGWASTELINSTKELKRIDKSLADKNLTYEGAFELDPKYTQFSQLYDVLGGIIKNNFEPYEIPPVTEKTIPAYLEENLPAGFYLSLTIDGLKLGDMFLKKSAYNEVNFDSLVLLGHEDIPGHHLQQSILIGLPLTPYEKANFDAAYIEGWASYCETLLAENINTDQPLYGDVLKINYDLMYSLSVLLDYDLHYGGMTRQEVIDKYKVYFGEDTEKEVDRTLVTPGEAIHYAFGRYTILKLRDETRKILGNQFDIKVFHDIILKAGPCTMTELKKTISRYLAAHLPAQNKLKMLFTIINDMKGI